jgi:hypothetical protein
VKHALSVSGDFFGRHPILGMLAFNVVAVPVMVLIGFLIRYYTHWNMSTIIFCEALLILLVCKSCVYGNNELRGFGYWYRNDRNSERDTYFGAYQFAIKYGILGVSLFIISGLFGVS